jgi:Tol biopolymer transport system component
LDGSQAAIVGTTVVGEHSGDIGDDIFVISREGQMSQLTYLAKHYGLGFNIYSLSWSPDSRYIAFWMWYPGVISNNWVLAVLDTSTKKVTDYCISTDPYARGGQSYFGNVKAPLWSPDGKQIIVEHRIKDSGYVVLLDIRQITAFQVAQNMVPLAWMMQEP